MPEQPSTSSPANPLADPHAGLERDAARTLIEASPDPCYLAQHAHFVYLNPAAVRMFRAPSAESIIGAPVLSRVAPVSQAILGGYIRRMADGASGIPRFDAVYLAMDGTPFDAEVEATAVQHGGHPAVLVAIRDVSARKAADAALRQSEERYRSLTSALQVGIVVHGPNAEILYANPKAFELLGLTEAELLGRTSIDPAWNVIHEDGSPFPGSSHPAMRTLETRTPVHDVVMGVHRPAHHDRIWLQVHADPVFGPDGELVQVVVSFTDITALKTEEFRSQRLRDFYAALAQANDAIARGTTPSDLYATICRVAVETGGVRMAWIGLADPGRGLVVPVASFGDDYGYLDGIIISLDPNDPHGQGPTGRAARDGVAVLVEDFQTDPGTTAWHERAARSGWVSSDALPLFEAGKVVGSLTLYAVDRQTFTPEVRRLLSDLAGSISLALDRFAAEQDRQKAAASLRESHAQYEQLFNGMLSGILLCEVLCDEHGTPVDHRFLSCNRASEVLTGVTAAELVGKTSIDAPIGWPLEVRARLYDVAMQGTTWQYDRVNETLGRHYETRVFSPRQGQFAHSFTDVTEQKRAEAQIRLDSAALAAANPILITDRTGRIESANDAFCAMTGYAMSEVIGETPTTLLKSGKQSPAFYAQLWQTILDGGVWRGEMVNRRKDGSLYTEESTITPLLDDQGQVTHFVTVKQDITDRQLLEAQFQQAQKMESVGRLAGGVAHDFNNMLSVILGRTELALMQLDADSPLRNDLEEVLSAGRHSADLTRQLLAFARRQTVSPRALDLNAEITKSLKLLRRLISEDIALQWLPAGTVWPVYLDPSQLDQILANLCVNARDAIEAARRGAPAGRSTADTVTISTGNCTLDAAFCASHLDATPGDYVRLRVADTGCGMSPDVMAKIFEPFFTTKPVGEGTGLGLATVFGAVRQNGGIITVDSRVDHGTSIEVFFRRSEAVEPTAAEPEESAPVGGHETILVVEDEPGVRRMTVFVLRRLGYTVLDAEDPVAALALESAHPGTIDLLITDMVMPEMSGTELVAALRQRRPGLRFRYMSGYTADDLTGPEHAEIRAHLIEKPIRPAELAIQVRTALDE